MMQQQVSRMQEDLPHKTSSDDMDPPSPSSIFFSRMSRLAKHSIREVLEASRVFMAGQLAKPPLPLLVFNTMPKSASVFITTWLARGLSASVRSISYGYFPFDTVDYSKAKQCARGNTISQEHLDASEMNQHILRQFIQKMVVHLRDPRQATLSWLHHLNRLHKIGNHDLLAFVYPKLPEGYFQFGFDEQSQWQIEQHLPLLIRWCSQWVEAQQSWEDIEILFTRYEDFREDGEAFMARLLEFFEIPADRFDRRVRPERSMAVHFRKGEADEWQTAFSSANVERANRQIPTDLAERFGW
jgi:hypothetical protein